MMMIDWFFSPEMYEKMPNLPPINSIEPSKLIAQISNQTRLKKKSVSKRELKLIGTYFASDVCRIQQSLA